MLDVYMEDGDPVAQQTADDADALAPLLTNRGQKEEDLSRLAAVTDSVFADQGDQAATMDAVDE